MIKFFVKNLKKLSYYNQLVLLCWIICIIMFKVIEQNDQIYCHTIGIVVDSFMFRNIIDIIRQMAI